MKTLTVIFALAVTVLAGCTWENVDQDHNKQCKENCNVINLVQRAGIEPLVPLDELQEFDPVDLPTRYINGLRYTRLPLPQVLSRREFENQAGLKFFSVGRWVESVKGLFRSRRKECELFAPIVAAGDHYAHMATVAEDVILGRRKLTDATFNAFIDGGRIWAGDGWIYVAQNVEREFQIECRDYI